MQKPLQLFLFLLLCQIASGQTVSTPETVVSSGATFTDDLIFDAQGNLYGSDYAGNSVFKLSPRGVISAFVSGLDSPNGLAFDSQGNLFVCDNTGNKIYKVNSAGLISDSFATSNPSGIIKDPNSDTLYFTSYLGNELKKLTPDGLVLPWLSGSPMNGPVGLCYDMAGQLYLSNFDDRKIFKVYPDSLSFLASMPGTNNSYLGFITYAFGSIWATNFQNHRIYRVFTNYTDSVVLYAGSGPGFTNGSLDSAKFRQPNGIVAKNDSLYISEYSTGHIRIISDIDADLSAPRSKLNAKAVHLYPNPCTGHISLSGFTLSDYSFYKIQSLGGQILKQGSLDAGRNLSVEELAEGFYFLILKGKGKQERLNFQKL